MSEGFPSLRPKNLALVGLVPCRDCRKGVSKRARSCPHCGCPRPGRRGSRFWNFLLWLGIIVVLMVIVAAIAVPNLLEARRRSNESAAIAHLKTLFVAQTQFRTMKMGGATRYAKTFQELVDHRLIDSSFLKDKKGAYRYILKDVGVGSFKAWAIPVLPEGRGHRRFYVDESGRITYSLFRDSNWPDASSSGIDD